MRGREHRNTWFLIISKLIAGDSAISHKEIDIGFEDDL